MTPARLSAWVVVVMQNIIIPGAGVFLTTYLLLKGMFEEWQLPLLVSMMGVPLIASADDPPSASRPE